MVGAVGFEPTTPWSQTRCATKLRHAPMYYFSSKWGGWRGSNPRQPESQSGALPTELQPPLQHFQTLNIKLHMVRLTGFEPVTIRLEGGCSILLSYRRMTYDIETPLNLCLEELVGAVGFEPTTPWSQTRCATKLRHAPIHLSFFRITHCAVRCAF